MRGLFKRGTVLFLSLVLASSLCGGDVFGASSKKNQYKMVWSDEFNGTTLNSKNWKCEIGYGGSNPGWGNNELQYYTDRQDNVKVSNGVLSIIGRADNYQFNRNGVINTAKYTSGRMISSNLQSFKYGRIEAKMKVPAVKGMWPAFWMLGYNPKGWPYCGEIDILETWNANNFAQGTIHFVDENSSTPNSDSYDASSYYNFKSKTDWHTYGLTWTPKEMIWTFDGIPYKTFPITGSNKTELRAQFYIILNMAIGGNLPYFPPDDNFTSATTMVDSVRVYQRASDKGSYTGTWTLAEKNQVPKVAVTYKNGNKIVSKQNILTGESTIIPTVKKSKYIFNGWYIGNKKISENTPIYTSTTVKAKWTKIKVNKAKITSTKQIYKKHATIKFKVAKYKKQKVSGFQVKIGSKKKNINSNILTLKGFKSGKTYSAKVRAYKIDSKGKKIYGKWSNAKKIKVK